jgi:hypothetical protein
MAGKSLSETIRYSPSKPCAQGQGSAQVKILRRDDTPVDLQMDTVRAGVDAKRRGGRIEMMGLIDLNGNISFAR